jgi:DNA-3-methyladenine glycosylase
LSRGRLLTAEALSLDPLDAARLLLGCVLVTDRPEGTVGVRLTEVEAYRGADDPAAHAYRGRTARNSAVFGPPGHLYVYFVYGMHFCANVVCTVDGVPGAVLLRAGEVVEGLDTARARRPAARTDAALARGPALLTQVLGLARADNDTVLTAPSSPVRLYAGRRIPPEQVSAGPRVGVAAAADDPWRYWITGDPTVSPYRRHTPRKRTSGRS